MSKIVFKALATEVARHYQSGGKDAYGCPPERQISDGDVVPCRHCLEDVTKGEAYLILAHRPFERLQPYAETGPIFLHARACSRAAETGDIPPMLARREAQLIKGYGSDDRILYGTGAVVPAASLVEAATAILADGTVAYVHVRSAKYNCYTCRIDRG